MVLPAPLLVCASTVIPTSVLWPLQLQQVVKQRGKICETGRNDRLRKLLCSHWSVLLQKFNFFASRRIILLETEGVSLWQEEKMPFSYLYRTLAGFRIYFEGKKQHENAGQHLNLRCFYGQVSVFGFFKINYCSSEIFFHFWMWGVFFTLFNCLEHVACLGGIHFPFSIKTFCPPYFLGTVSSWIFTSYLPWIRQQTLKGFLKMYAVFLELSVWKCLICVTTQANEFEISEITSAEPPDPTQLYCGSHGAKLS